VNRYYEPPRRPAIFGYLELLRLPNLFTAVADVAMGFLFVQAAWFRGIGLDPDGPLRPIDKQVLGLLAAASALLYAAGVVLNDVFDVELDRQERPERPLPSGRVPLGAARAIGWGLLFGGAALPWIACLLAPKLWQLERVEPILQFRPGIVAVVLAAAIVLYNAVLKRTIAGPVGMGACRMLNVLLGMSLLPGQWQLPHWLVAGAIGVYIAGVTWFARDESGESSPLRLGGATMLMLAGIAMLASLRIVAEEYPIALRPLANLDAGRWYFAMALFAGLIGVRCFWAASYPSPGRVRVAVTQAIISLVVLDAIACYAARGTYWAAAILLLLIPTMLLARWIKPT
jgi:4-hydroxybenzoate polyprenyltransferase